jgi:hypothetical protein
MKKYTKEVTKTFIDFSKLKTGLRFSYIETGFGEPYKVKGQLFVENKNRIYFCNDDTKKIHDNYCKFAQKLGYNNSWLLEPSDYADKDLDFIQEDLTITDLKFTSIPKDFVKPIFIEIDNKIVEFKDGYIQVGCKTIDNDVIKTICANLKPKK